MLSIIIPCFNEEQVIYGSIEKILDWSDRNNLIIELVIVNNASTDKTISEVNKFKNQKNLVLLNEDSKGKGFAVIKGLRACNYNKALILDADLSADISEFNLSWLNRDNLLIIGSRRLGREINTPVIRKISGSILNFIERKILNVEFKDIHCGFKYIVFDQLIEIANDLDSNEYLYDLDLLLWSINKGLEVEESPITYFFDRNSSISLLKDPFIMLKDLYKLKQKYK